jgi:hypothetical protein
MHGTATTRLALRAAVLGAAALLLVQVPPSPAATGEAVATGDAATAGTAQAPSGAAAVEVNSLADLNLLSAGLIENAASGRSPAHEFRMQSTLYRERLRRLMLEQRDQPAAQRLPESALLEMVRMSALLHAAAACRTGSVITCPADLMLRMRAQQQVVTAQVAALRAGKPGAAP